MKTDKVYIGTIMQCGDENHFTREYKTNTILIKINDEEYVSFEELLMNKLSVITKKYNVLPTKPLRSGSLYVDNDSVEPFFELYKNRNIRVPKRIGTKKLMMTYMLDPRSDVGVKNY